MPGDARLDAVFKARRFVDWTGLYAQLGLTLNWHMPIPGPTPA